MMDFPLPVFPLLAVATGTASAAVGNSRKSPIPLLQYLGYQSQDFTLLFEFRTTLLKVASGVSKPDESGQLGSSAPAMLIGEKTNWRRSFLT
jgi:hypothetical protein